MNLTRTQRWAGRATATVLLLGALGGSGRAAPANAAPAQHAATLSPLTLDSLETGDFSYAFIAAPDAQTLAALRRDGVV